MNDSTINSTAWTSAAVRWLFAAGLVTIPFDGVRGTPALGELGYELSFPFFGAAVALGVLTSLRRGEAGLSSSLSLRVALVMLCVVLASYVVNVTDVHGITFRERTGANKFLTSLMVVLYGMGLAWLSEQIDEKDFMALVSRFVCWSAMISILYVGVELVGRSGLAGGLFHAVDNIVHSRQAEIINSWDGSINQKLLEGWDYRFRSVSFEPPAFGNYTGFAWPWVWYAAVASSGARKYWAYALLVVFTGVIVSAASRTGLMMLAANVTTIIWLVMVYTRRARSSEAAAAARVILPLLLAATAIMAVAWAADNYQHIVGGIVGGESVSNLSRLSFQVAGLKMFLANPVFGVGLGQFGFHVTEFLPDWAHLSSEVAPMITFPEAPWPAVYSLYGRLAAELGALGLAGWCALWLGLAASLASRRRKAPASGGSFVNYHWPVILNCVGVMASGFTTDTFRTPMIWISLGLACAVIRRRSRSSSLPLRFGTVPG